MTDSIKQLNKIFFSAIQELIKFKTQKKIHLLQKRFKNLRDIMPSNHPGDLPWNEWLQLFGLCKAYKPNVVFEFGRGYGNSTLIFDFCLNKNIKFYSFCMHNYKPIQEKLSEKNIFLRKNTKIFNTNIIGYPFRNLGKGKSKTLVFWDAHGFEVAEEILTQFLPKLSGEIFVIMHDIKDLRFNKGLRKYGNKSIWKAEPEKWPGPSIVINNLVAQVAQLVCVNDFCFRNFLTLQSSSFLNSIILPNLNKEKQQALKDIGFVPINDLACFLISKSQKISFPKKTYLHNSKCTKKQNQFLKPQNEEKPIKPKRKPKIFSKILKIFFLKNLLKVK